MSVLLGLGVLAVVGWIAWVVFGQARTQHLDERRAHDHADLVASRPGGAPDRAVSVASPAEIEPRVGREPCPWCAGTLRVVAHEVEEHDDRLLRRVDAKCSACGRITPTWFHVDAPLPN